MCGDGRRLTPNESLCPRCGRRMGVLDGRERTVPGGVWAETRCPNCGLVRDVFRARPKRQK